MSAPRVMLITGTRKGIGRHLAERYVARGYRVVGVSRGRPDWTLDGYEHHEADVADEKAVQALFFALRKKHGRLDVLINNAGIASMNSVLLTPLATMQAIFATNVFGTFLFCREAARLMSQEKRGGRIVNFATVATPLKLEGEAAYAASKAAVVSLTEILARELAPFAITVNAVGPTPIDTDLIRSVPREKMDALIARQALPRMGTMEDVANVIDFFLREESDFVTGQVVYLGGRLMAIEFLLDVFRAHSGEEAIVFRDRPRTFQQLLDDIASARAGHSAQGIGPGAVVALEADFSPAGIAQLLALLGSGAICVPLAPASSARHEEYRRIADVTHRITVDAEDRAAVARTGAAGTHPLYDVLKASGHPGLVLFTSGSAGEPKAAVHDGERLLAKYKTPRQRLRTLLFLLFDHIGGFDTLLQALSNACAVIVPAERTPEAVATAIERHRAEVLPASPSFLGLLLLSEAPARHDLSSLRYITYGAEVMPQVTLTRLHAAFPGVTLLQKYGLTELGTMRSRSSANDSLWVKIGGEGFATRVKDGLLEIHAQSSMLGYLNAPSPFTEDGWFMTGDAVEQDGEYFRIKGRVSDLINVGGRKVYPAEVEAVVAEVENVADVSVFGEPHPFTGAIVVARVTLEHEEDPRALEQRVRAYCRTRLEAYMVPAKVLVVLDDLSTERDKKVRRAGPGA